MNCTKHPDREASGICVHCGKFFCNDCLVEVDGKNYCRTCLSEVFAEMKEDKNEKANMPNINISTSSSSTTNTTNNNENTNTNTNTNDNYNANVNYNANANYNPNMNTGYIGYQTRPMFSDRSKSTALLLCVFLGYLGAHQFYARKAGMGILYFFTAGLFGIGWLVDIVRIASGSFKDSYGLPIIYNNPALEFRYQQSMVGQIPGQAINRPIPNQPLNNPNGYPINDPIPDNPRTMNGTQYSPFITWDSYCRISSGMSYQEVCMLLGQEGIPVSAPDPYIQSYQWNGADNNSYALLSFSNGTLVDKEQQGLR